MIDETKYKNMCYLLQDNQLTQFDEDSIVWNMYGSPLLDQTINKSSLHGCRNHQHRYLFALYMARHSHCQETQNLSHLD